VRRCSSFLAGPCRKRKTSSPPHRRRSSERFADCGVVDPVLFQTLNASRPPGTSTRRISRSATSLSGKELQSLLTAARVELASGNCSRTALHSIHSIGCATAPEAISQRDHSRIQIQTTTRRPNRPAAPQCESRRGSRRATSNARSPVARPAASTSNGAHGRGCTERLALVQFGSLRAQLPLLVLGHLPFHPSLRDMRSAVCVTAMILGRSGDAGTY